MQKIKQREYEPERQICYCKMPSLKKEFFLGSNKEKSNMKHEQVGRTIIFCISEAPIIFSPTVPQSRYTSCKYWINFDIIWDIWDISLQDKYDNVNYLIAQSFGERFKIMPSLRNASYICFKKRYF